MPSSIPGPKHNDMSIRTTKARPKTSDEYLHMAFGGFVGKALRGLGHMYESAGAKAYDLVKGPPKLHTAAQIRANRAKATPVTTAAQTRNPGLVRQKVRQVGDTIPAGRPDIYRDLEKG